MNRKRYKKLWDWAKVKVSRKLNNERNDDLVRHTPEFLMFCLWSVILLCRPQDYLPVLAAFRPSFTATAFMLIMIIIYSKNIKGFSFANEKQVIRYILLYFVMIVGIVTSLYTRLSFEIVLTQYIITVFYFLIFYKLVPTIEKVRSVVFCCCLGSLIYFLVSISNYDIASGRLAYGGMFDANDIAYFALVFFPLNLIFITRGYKFLTRLIAIGSFGLGIFLVLLTGSRGGFLALLVAMLLLLFRTNLFKSSVKVWVLLLSLILFSFASAQHERLFSIFSLEQDYNVQSETGRLEIWKIGLRVFIDNPLTGVGVGQFNYAVGLDRELRGADTLGWQTAHNSFVQIGAETGALGLGLFLLLSLNIFRIFDKVRKKSVNIELVRIAEAGMVGFGAMFTAAMFLSQAYSIYWVFYVVFSAVVHQIFLKQSESSLSQVTKRV